MRRFAISDIHGCRRTFKTLIKEKLALKRKDQLFILGDLVNKGPNSEGVVRYILKLKRKGYQIQCLRGNHDQLYLEGLYTYDPGHPHCAFFESLPYALESPPFIFVHAGLNFALPDPLRDTYSIMHIRGWQKRLNRKWLNGRIIIHGHDRRNRTQIKAAVKKRGPIICIDNGCVATHMPGQGSLCALDLDSWTLYFQKNIDM